MICQSGFRALGLVVLCAVLSGCVSPCASNYGGPWGPCVLSGRNTDCGGGGSGVVAGPCDTGACDTGACDTGACDTGACDTGVCDTGVCDTGVCDTGTCGTPCCSFPLLKMFHNMVTCNAGCGRVYWGEWAADPPQACDPCDDCGNWVGPQCGPTGGCGNLFKLLCGARFHQTCGSPACADCVGTAQCDCGVDAVEGDVLDGPWTETIESIETAPGTPVTERVVPLQGASQRPATRDPNSRLVRRNRTPIVH